MSLVSKTRLISPYGSVLPNPIWAARGLTFADIPAWRSDRWSAQDSVQRIIRPAGPAIKFSALTGRIGLKTSVDTLNFNSVFTMLLYCQINGGSSQGWPVIFGTQNYDTGTTLGYGSLELYSTTSQMNLSIRAAGNSAWIDIIYPSVEGVPMVWVGRRTSTELSLWNNLLGKVGSLNNPSFGDSRPSGTTGGYGRSATGSSGQTSVDIFASAWFNKPLSDSEIWSLLRNPWSLFQSQPNPYFYAKKVNLSQGHIIF